MGAAKKAAGSEDTGALVKAMETVVKRFPKSPLALYGLAGAQVRAEKEADAVTSLERAVALWSEYLEAWSELGDVRLRLGRHEAAAAAYRRAMAIEPRDLSVASQLGAALVGAKDFPRAITVLERVTESAPDAAEPWAWLGVAYLEAGRLDDAAAGGERHLVAGILQEGLEALGGARLDLDVLAADHVQRHLVRAQEGADGVDGVVAEQFLPHLVRQHRDQTAGDRAPA